MNQPPTLRDRVIEAIQTVFDPEIPVNIWELGLIYRLDVSEKGEVEIDMTLTSPACPVAESLPAEVKERVHGVKDVSGVILHLVWEPTWDMNRMSESALLELGLL